MPTIRPGSAGRPPRPALRVAVAVLLSAALLSACGGDEPSEADEDAAAPGLAALPADDVDGGDHVPDLALAQDFPLPEGAIVVSGTETEEHRWSLTFAHEIEAMDAVLAFFRDHVEGELGYEPAVADHDRVEGQRVLAYSWHQDTISYETAEGVELASERFRIQVRGIGHADDGVAQWQVSWNDALLQRERVEDH